MNGFKILILILSSVQIGFSQMLKIEAYAYEAGNRGYLNQVDIKVLDSKTDSIMGAYQSNIDGFVSFELKPDRDYNLLVEKEMFESLKIGLNIKGIKESKKFLKLEMQRLPGYIFEIAVLEENSSLNEGNLTLLGALIEVYNNTTKKVEMIIEESTAPEFRINLIKGNHYTIMVRKKGYLAKRMEAYVDVEGCILCFEGLGKMTPGVIDNLTESNTMGQFVANVEMEKVETGKTMKINNLYYDFGKYNLKHQARKELDKVITVINDNPDLKLELGSHTDSRGTIVSNILLSNNRANEAVRYILNRSEILPERLMPKGYGEQVLTNECADNVDCTEEQHAANRRTELKILGTYELDKPFVPLLELKRKELRTKLLEELIDQEVIIVKEGDVAPEFLKETKTIEEEVLELETQSKIENSNPSSDSRSNYRRAVNYWEGFKIVVFESNKKLEKTDELFENYANLLEYFRSNNDILYLYGSFRDYESAETFLESIKDFNPEAYIIELENGKIKK